MQSEENVVAYADKYIDLHLHLDGAITPEIAKKLAEVQNIKLPTDDDQELEKLLTVPEDCTSLNDFLKCFELPDSLMMTKEGLCEAVYLVAENIQSQGLSMPKSVLLPNSTQKKECHRRMLCWLLWKA